MADPVTALMVVAGASKAAQAGVEIFGEQEKEEAINLAAKQRELQYQQKTLANYDTTNKILDAQLVQASARGISLGSPSLEAIQRETSNVGARRQANLDIEEDIFERNARIEKENARMSLAAQLFGDAASFATQAAGAAKAMPKGA